MRKGRHSGSAVLKINDHGSRHHESGPKQAGHRARFVEQGHPDDRCDEDTESFDRDYEGNQSCTQGHEVKHRFYVV